MTEFQKLAVENLNAAVLDKPARSYAAVVAGEVVAACDLIEPADRDDVVNALRAGAAAVRPQETVFQLAWQVAHLCQKLPATPE